MNLDILKAWFHSLGVALVTRDANGNASMKVGIGDNDIALGKGKPVAITVGRNLTNDDDGCVLVNRTNTARTMTIPAGLRDGFSCKIIQGGTGVVTVAAGASVTAAGLVGLKTAGANSVIRIEPYDTDSYKVTGDTAA
jgi:hypothetical protein